MNKQTKYYFLIKATILSFIINLVLGFVKRTLQNLYISSSSILNPVIDLIGVINVLLIIVMILGALYLLILIISYYGSKFYTDYKISVFEGIYHGFIDIHHVYDKLKSSSKVKDIQVDFKRSTIYFDGYEKNYCLKYLDLFGKIEGKLDSEFWASVSKPKKKYNQKVYTY